MDKIQETIKKFEKIINAKLNIYYNSVEDNNPDESYGQFVSTNVEPEPFLNANDNNLCINIYEDNKIQFFYDATPFPVNANTEEEKRQMSFALIHYPIDIKYITYKDYENFIINVKNQIE